MAMIRQEFRQLTHDQLCTLLEKSLDIIETAAPSTTHSAQQIIQLARETDDNETLREIVIDSLRLVMDWQKFQPEEAIQSNFTAFFRAKPIPNSYKMVMQRKLDDMLTKLQPRASHTLK